MERMIQEKHGCDPLIGCYVSGVIPRHRAVAVAAAAKAEEEAAARPLATGKTSRNGASFQPLGSGDTKYHR